MEALILKIRNLDELTCTSTSAKSNVFVPSNLIYRITIQGAMLRAKLFSEGRNYAFEYNQLLNAFYNVDTIEGNKPKAAGKFYRDLIDELPKVTVSDGVLLLESLVRKEVFNSIYRETSTALASLKASDQLAFNVPNNEFKFKQGKLQGETLSIRTGLYSYNFSNLSDTKLREIMIARVGERGHLFRVPGAIWRIGFLGERRELEETLELFKIALNDVGFGAKHAFRGKGEILSHEFCSVSIITQDNPQTGFLVQPLICNNGGLFETLKLHGLNPKYGFQISQRKTDFFPLGKSTIALDGKFEASKGLIFEFEGEAFLWSQ